MLKILLVLWPSAWVLRKILGATVVSAVAVAAFFWGRHAGVAQTRPFSQDTTHVPFPGSVTQAKLSDNGQRVVAYLFDSIPVTREELGEYLIVRYGAERIEFLVNRRIVELACRSKGIYVTDVEVQHQLQEDLKGFGVSEKEFGTQVLKRFNKTLYEWKEDVIRPKIALAKYCRPLIKIEDDDLRKAFEARYGEKVKCRMIVLQANGPQPGKIWEEVSKSEEAFREHARKQFIPELASKGGEIPPIHRHFGDINVEREAFSLKPGQVSKLLEMPDKTRVILKCDGFVPPDPSARFEDERSKLMNELTELKVVQRIPEEFQNLRKQANPKIFLTQQVRQEELERAVHKELKELSGPPVSQ